MTEFLKPFLDLGVQTLAAVALSLGSAVCLWLLKKLRLDSDATVRGYLLDALAGAVAFGEARVRARLGGAAPMGAAEWREAGLHAATYVAGRVPDALKHFRITPEGLAQLIEARITVASQFHAPAEAPQPAGESSAEAPPPAPPAAQSIGVGWGGSVSLALGILVGLAACANFTAEERAVVQARAILCAIDAAGKLGPIVAAGSDAATTLAQSGQVLLADAACGQALAAALAAAATPLPGH
jgi:hypothetical protein